MRLRWRLYRDSRRQYRVSAKATNGRRVFASSEGYCTKRSALRNVGIFGAPVTLLDTWPVGEWTGLCRVKLP